jgi:ferredoxin
VCPNQAVALGHAVYRILARLFTECVGFADEPQCASVCPEGAVEESGAEGPARVPALAPLGRAT